MTAPGPANKVDLPLILGIASSGCAAAGVAAWVGYARTAGAAIQAVVSRTPAETHGLAALAEWYRLAHLLLGLSAVGLAWYALTRTGISRPAKWVGRGALVFGVMVFLLILLIV
jgi:hypothetical protein